MKLRPLMRALEVKLFGQQSHAMLRNSTAARTFIVAALLYSKKGSFRIQRSILWTRISEDEQAEVAIAR